MTPDASWIAPALWALVGLSAGYLAGLLSRRARPFGLAADLAAALAAGAAGGALFALIAPERTGLAGSHLAALAAAVLALVLLRRLRRS